MQASCVVINVAPRLPWHPGFDGKLTNHSPLLSRSPIRLDRINASKVSPSGVSHSTDVSRFCFDVAASTDESNDSISTLWRVSGWLRSTGTSQVSHFAVLHLFIVDMLDLDVYRCDLDATTLTVGSNYPTAMFQNVSAWLHDSRASQVSLFDFMHLADICSFKFESSVLTAPSNNSIWTVRGTDMWP